MTAPAPSRDERCPAVRYVALGDSSTEGLEDLDDTGALVGWSLRLARRLAAAHGPIAHANLAIRGQTSRDLLLRQLPAAVALRPTLATVVIGMNDMLRFTSAADVVANITVAASTLQAVGAQVVTLTVPDPTPVMRVARPIRGRLERMNAGIRALADDGVAVVDLAGHPVTSDPRLWHEDRLHGNPLAHERVALAVAATLGLEVDVDWRRPVQGPVEGRTMRQGWDWTRVHVLPWIGRRIRGQSSGDGRDPRFPNWVEVA